MTKEQRDALVSERAGWAMEYAGSAMSMLLRSVGPLCKPSDLALMSWNISDAMVAELDKRFVIPPAEEDHAAAEVQA